MKISNKERVLELLKDGKPHYSAEFRDRLGLLEYRKRISELRQDGYLIVSIKTKDLFQHSRPAYILLKSEAA